MQGRCSRARPKIQEVLSKLSDKLYSQKNKSSGYALQLAGVRPSSSTTAGSQARTPRSDDSDPRFSLLHNQPCNDQRQPDKCGGEYIFADQEVDERQGQKRGEENQIADSRLCCPFASSPTATARTQCPFQKSRYRSRRTRPRDRPAPLKTQRKLQTRRAMHTRNSGTRPRPDRAYPAC